MPGKRSLAMLADDEQIQGLQLPNALELPPSHTAAVIGHLLKSMHADTLKEVFPGSAGRRGQPAASGLSP